MYLITTIIELGCLLSAILFLKKSKEIFWQLFIVYLSMIVVFEITGLIVWFQFQIKNHWLYNIQLPFLALFMFFILSKIGKEYYNTKPILIIAMVAFFAMYFYESIQANFKGYSKISSRLLSISLVIMACLYFYHLLKSNKIIVIKSNPFFWIVSGVFFFYFGKLAVDFFFDYLVSINTLNARPVRFFIMAFLNLILYTSWGYAFLCKYRQTI